MFLSILEQAKKEDSTEGKESEGFSSLNKLNLHDLEWLKEVLASEEHSDSAESNIVVSDEKADHHRDRAAIQERVRKLSKSQKIALRQALEKETQRQHMLKTAARKLKKTQQKTARTAAAPVVRKLALTAIEKQRRIEECHAAIREAQRNNKLDRIPEGKRALQEKLRLALHKKAPDRNPKPTTTRFESTGDKLDDLMAAVSHALKGGSATLHPGADGPLAFQALPSSALVRAAQDFLALDPKGDVLNHLLTIYDDIGSE